MIKKAFTLIELLVVISIITVLLAILLPALSVSRAQGRGVVCGNNIHQLLLAAMNYSQDNDGFYMPAAYDYFGAKLLRWHGGRSDTSERYNPKKGPLASYLNEVFIACPERVRFRECEPASAEYDEGGGYGYNMVYIGSQIWRGGYEDEFCRGSAKSTDIKSAQRTLMFADTAGGEFKDSRKSYIKYSFAEPRFFVVNTEPTGTWDPVPSIHFRHRRRANVGWCDGHISSEKITKSGCVNPDGLVPETMDIGWFEPLDNTLFDLE